MILLDRDTLRSEMNRCGTERRPFLWGISYDLEKGFLICDPTQQDEILWRVGPHGNTTHIRIPTAAPTLAVKTPVPRDRYALMFSIVMRGLMRGDSFLANLTGATEVTCTGTLREIFLHSEAPFRLLLGDEFVCFSPEPFVRIKGREISTYPMKGTADASVPGAAERLLADYKETCEHHTIVDLMRNDLNSVATDVKVRRFRYLEEIATASGPILQTSSEVCGLLPEECALRFGDIILPLLPAGSITGAPKESTVRIINEAECTPRGWYTGVFGYFDGEEMLTAVMIRCVQRAPDGRLYFHSGGGVTVNSCEEDEYAELMAKVRLPTVNHNEHIEV